MQFEISIWNDYATRNANIIILDRTYKDGRVVNLYTKEVYILKENESIPDNFILKIPSDMAKEFFRAFAETLNKQGIKTENDFKIQGLLDATKYHLEDMRKIVFKIK